MKTNFKNKKQLVIILIKLNTNYRLTNYFYLK